MIDSEFVKNKFIALQAFHKRNVLNAVHLVEPSYRVLIPNQVTYMINGGRRGIRTLDTVKYTHFPGVRLRPLGHPSKFDLGIIDIPLNRYKKMCA